MSNHTPEPWSLLEAGDSIKHQVPVSSDRTSILTIATEGAIAFGAVYSADDARRIVACVNACRGLGTDELEQHGLVSAVGYELIELTKQRDELLDALSGLVDFIEIDDLNIDALALKIAKDAIAKTKAGSENHSPDAGKMVAPEGWQLVPVEPTLEMISAATRDSVGFGTRAEYKAMLAAAPKFEGGAA